MRSRALLLTFCLIFASCGGDSPDTGDLSDTTQAASPVALHPIPLESVGVTGTASCNFSDLGTDPEDPEGESGDLVTCELEMSDPRVSGTETHDRFRYYNIGDDSLAWVAEEAVITNEEGTWRGIVQAGDDGTPIGEAHYVGEGAYDGLEFHYYFAHTALANTAEVRGWISGGRP